MGSRGRAGSHGVARTAAETVKVSPVAGGEGVQGQATGETRVPTRYAVHRERGQLDEGDARARARANQDARPEDIDEVGAVRPRHDSHNRPAASVSRPAVGVAEAPMRPAKSGATIAPSMLATASGSWPALVVERQEEEQGAPYGPQQHHQQIARADPAGVEQRGGPQGGRSAPRRPSSRRAGQGEGDGRGTQQIEPPGCAVGGSGHERRHGGEDARRPERDGVEDPRPAPHRPGVRRPLPRRRRQRPTRPGLCPGRDRTGTGRARPGRARPGRARPGRARPGRARPGRARPGRARPGRARPGRARKRRHPAPHGRRSAGPARPPRIPRGRRR